MIFRYEHPEYFKDMPRTDFGAWGGNLVLFGAGVNGAIAARLLERQGVGFICFADSDRRKWGTEFFGRPVISPDEMKGRHPDAAILVTPYQVKAAFEQVKDMGYSNVFAPLHMFLEIDVDDVMDVLPGYFSESQFPYAISRYMRKLAEYFVLGFGALKIMTVVLTERCTLRCRECMNFMPHYRHPRNYDWGEMRKALGRLFEIETFFEVVTEGGEIFLHPNLPDLMEMLIESPKVDKITPITNGTIMPDARTLAMFRHPKVTVRISNYGEHSYGLKGMAELFDREGVQYHVMLQPWIKCNEIRLYDRTMEQTQEVYVNCCKSDGTPFLWNGRLYKCQFAGSVEQLGAIPRNPDDSVDLLAEPHDPQGLRERVERFYKRVPFIDACRYCLGRYYRAEPVPFAEQLVGAAPELPDYAGGAV